MTSVVRHEDKRAAAEARILQEAFVEAGQVVFAAMADLFPSRPCRMSARDYTTGLLASLERKNCVTIAEWAGHASPDRLHYLLERAVWEERELRVRIGALAVERLGSAGVLIFDETGDLKKGRASLGAARQYTGTAGRVENAQVSTWAVWATAAGHALIDYEVYLHKEWFAEGDARLGAAHAPGPVAKRTKGQQAAEMLRRLLTGPARPTAVSATGDEVYGSASRLRSRRSTAMPSSSPAWTPTRSAAGHRCTATSPWRGPPCWSTPWPKLTKPPAVGGTAPGT